MGSSSAAIVAGLALARELLVGGRQRLDDDALFAVAAELEGHPDNVAAAVYGGFTIAYGEAGSWHAVRLEVTSPVVPVVLVPGQPLETSVARGLLPELVPHADAARNAGRAALLVAALTGRPEELMAATEDRLHEQYRAAAMPQSAALVARLRAAGRPAVVSGAGPTVLALVPPDEIAAVSAAAPEGWRALALEVDREGVRPAG
jgi:homoserine kinase